MAKSKSNGLSYEDIESSIRQKIFSPVYLFYGEEDFLIKQTVDLLIKHSLNEAAKSFNLDIVQGSDLDARGVISLASAYPMMSDLRVVIVRDFDRLADKEALIPLIEKPPPTTVLVLISEKADFRLKLYKSLQTLAVTVKFNQLYEDKIPTWITNRIMKLEKEITSEACQLLQSHVGRSLREIQNEINKLFIYLGDKKIIDIDDVNAVVGMSKRYNIFELQNAIGNKNFTSAQDILTHMLDAGEYPVGIIIMLTKYFQKLWIIHDFIENKITRDELIETLRLSFKQIPHLNDEIAIAKNYSSSSIERSFSVLSETDEKLKSSSQDEKLLLTLMLNGLLSRV
jgi:DNA polymerase-3 subunit delta